MSREFNVGDRVMVPWGGGKAGTVARDEGGGDYLIELDELEEGRRKRLGCQGRILQRIGTSPAAAPPVEGMVTKGAGAPRTPLTAVVDPFADDDEDLDEGTGAVSEPESGPGASEPAADSNPEEPPAATGG